ncbi:hypothetical protein WA1_51670 [Scytonema hofmannii PCC 7110]|uniref:Uncharacterized protein n=1 Tax=Scytonema hofmannii PCC 7110 TaxID=128403 RepID=A0A139WPW2_9CYAN|nr:hypothetical protein [Scytonema hofmannii]KYC34466.1 hypothetical protein WA1_51670 [Scytonema hofmannii PCC 7110]
MSNSKQAKVAKVVNIYSVVLNVGSNNGVEIGDDYIIYRIGDEILDPDTGESLGEYEKIIGRGTITHVQDKISTLESSEIKDSGRKVIRKFTRTGTSAIWALSNALGSPSEEVIEEPEKIMRPFSNAEIGDHAKRV